MSIANFAILNSVRRAEYCCLNATPPFQAVYSLGSRPALSTSQSQAQRLALLPTSSSASSDGANESLEFRSTLEAPIAKLESLDELDPSDQVFIVASAWGGFFFYRLFQPELRPAPANSIQIVLFHFDTR